MWPLGLLLAIAASKLLDVKTTAIKSIFLQVKSLEGDVYLKPPKESITPAGMNWKLKYLLFGLKDCPRQFYLRVKEELDKLGFEQCSVEPAIFCYKKNGKLDIIICSHVDDFLLAGDEFFLDRSANFGGDFLQEKLLKVNFITLISMSGKIERI
jgi:hypothetical protein